jgi:hypothetical protein
MNSPMRRCCSALGPVWLRTIPHAAVAVHSKTSAVRTHSASLEHVASRRSSPTIALASRSSAKQASACRSPSLCDGTFTVGPLPSQLSRDTSPTQAQINKAAAPTCTRDSIRLTLASVPGPRSGDLSSASPAPVSRICAQRDAREHTHPTCQIVPPQASLGERGARIADALRSSFRSAERRITRRGTRSS